MPVFTLRFLGHSVGDHPESVVIVMKDYFSCPISVYFFWSFEIAVQARWKRALATELLWPRCLIESKFSCAWASCNCWPSLSCSPSFVCRCPKRIAFCQFLVNLICGSAVSWGKERRSLTSAQSIRSYSCVRQRLGTSVHCNGALSCYGGLKVSFQLT